MATLTAKGELYNDLNRMVKHWELRLRFRRLLLLLPFSIAPGLTIGILVDIVARMQPLMTADRIALLSLGLVAAGVLVLLLVLRFWPRPKLHWARYFDLEFDLKERVSTALELLSGTIDAPGEMTDRQLEDAHETARTIEAGERIKMIIRWRSWIGVAVLAALLAAALLIPNPFDQALAKDTAQQVSIQQATDELRDIVEQVASDPALNADERDALLQSLETTIEKLKDEQITTEEAYALMSDAQSKLQQQANNQQQQINQQQDALASAAQDLRPTPPAAVPPDQPTPTPTAVPSANQNSPQGQIGDALNNMAEQAPQMDAQQRQDAASQLNQAAQDLQQAAPGLSEAMQQMAQAMQNADSSQLQAAQQNAQQAMDQLQASQQAAQQSQQSMQQNADAAQQQSDQLSQSSSSSQDESKSRSGTQEGQAQGGQNADQSSSSESQQSPSDSGAQQPSDTNSNATTNAGSSEMSQQGAQSGAGDAAGNDSAPTNFQSNGDPVQQGNSPTGEGEDTYEQIYAPQALGGGPGSDAIMLEPDAGSVPLSEGDVSQNPTGQSTVPYNQVYGDYSTAARHAIEGGYVPLGLRDVVRQYFTSLQPNP